MKAILLTILSLGVLCFTGASVMFHAQQETTQEQTSANPALQTGPFMRAKLAASQQVLDGLVSENFELIRQGASSMKQISEAVRWPQSKDEIYNHHGQAFRQQCDEIIKLADAGNLQAVHYAYLHLTTSCYQCHDYVRKKFRVEPNPDPKGPVRLIPGHWEGETFRPDRSARRGWQDGR